MQDKKSSIVQSLKYGLMLGLWGGASGYCYMIPAKECMPEIEIKPEASTEEPLEPVRQTRGLRLLTREA